MKNLDPAYIQAKNPWLNHVFLTEASASTQLDAKASPESNSLFLAEEQTATYGRFGREYFSAGRDGIYMSLSLQAKSDFQELPQYTVLAAAAVVAAIEKLTDKKPLIKWVNDIYIDGKKCVGILSEARSQAGEGLQVILGMGINFSVAEFPADLAEKAGSLFSKDETPNISRSELIAEIWRQFHLLAEEDFRAIYKSHSLVLGRTVSFLKNGEEMTAKALDIADNGALIVETSEGRRSELFSGEISLKTW